MRPADIKREIERLTVDAALARSQLGVLRTRLSEARAMIDQVRRAAERGADARAEGTPEPEHAQGEAKAG